MNHEHKIRKAKMVTRETIQPNFRAVLPLLLLLAVVVTAFAPKNAFADATTYSTTKRTFKVGILLLDSAGFDFGTTPPTPLRGGPENPDPFVFYIADARTDVKPQNWDIVNPLAPGTVTPEIKARWDARDPNNTYQIGQKLTKNMAAYWEVSLTQTSQTDLLQYDLLFITNHRDVQFRPAEREKMRKLVDAGGIIWIEDCGNMRIRGDGKFFLDELQFRQEGSANNAGPVINVPNHPILNTPYQLTFAEIANLGDKNYSNFYMSKFDPSETGNINRGTSGRGLGAPNPEVLVNIVGNNAANNLPYIAAGNYGSGGVIATSGDSGCDINDYVGGTNAGSGGNSGAYCGMNLTAAHTEDLKFVYNLIAWGGANATERRNNRRTAASFDSSGAPLVSRFNTTDTVNGNTTFQSRTAPLVVKGVVFTTGIDSAGHGTVRAYNATPGISIDGNPNRDAGIPDHALGTSADLVWKLDLGDAKQIAPSSPVYSPVYDPVSGTTNDVIFVTGGDGTLYAINAFPADGLGRLLPQPPAPITNKPIPYGATTYANGFAIPPVIVEGRVHVVQPDGLIRCIRAAAPTVTLWTSFNAAPTPTLQPLGLPTAGYSTLNSSVLQATRSNGTTADLMLYLPVREDNNGTVTGSVLPYWLGTRNEVQKDFANPAQGIFNTRVAGAGGAVPNRYFIANEAGFIKPTVRIFANDTDPNGNPRSREDNYAAGRESTVYKATFLTNGSDYNGQVQVASTGGGVPNPGDVMIAVDYDVIYARVGGGTTPPGLTGNGARDAGPLRINDLDTTAGSNLLTTPTASQSLVGLAFSPDDLLFYLADQNINGRTAAGATQGVIPTTIPALYAMNEQFGTSGTATRLRGRYVIHDGSAPNGTQVDQALVNDPAPIQNLLQFDPNYINSAAAIELTDNKGQKLPENLTDIHVVGAPVTTNSGITYALARATSAANGNVSVVMAFKSNQPIILNTGGSFIGSPQVFQYDSLTGNINRADDRIQLTLDPVAGKITVNNYQSLGGGNALSNSQSFVVRVQLSGAASETVQVHAPLNSQYKDDFSPLLWYYVLPYVPTSSLSLNGDYLYFTQRRGNGSGLVAVEANPGSNDPAVQAGQQIINVVNTLTVNGVARPNPINHVAWATENFGNAGSTAYSAPVGSPSALFINTSAGLFAYEDVITLITDAKRVLESNVSGAALWSLDSTYESTTAGGELPVYNGNGTIANPPATGRRNIDRRPLSKPQFAHRISSDDYIIADTGNNRVVRVDRSGSIRWTLDKIADPFNLLASGDPISLNEPTDVVLYQNRRYPVPGNDTDVAYEVHYIVADAGNSRVVEVVDYFNRNGTALDAPGNVSGTSVVGQHSLVWSTRTNSKEGRRLRYQSLQFAFIFGTDPVSGQSGYGFPQLTAVVGNTSAVGTGSTAGNDFTGGSLVSLDYKPYNTTFSFRDAGGNFVNIYTPWPANPDPRNSEPRGNGTILSSADDLVFVNPDGSTRIKHITRPLYFEKVTRQSGVSYVLCDADGVYEVVPGTDANGKQVLYITWFFSQTDYNYINAVNATGAGTGRLSLPAGYNPAQLPGFLPSNIRRLENGHYLITNAYGGRSPFFDTGQFQGEVFEIVPIAPGAAVKGMVPTAEGGTFPGFSTPRIISPSAGVNRQIMGSSQSNTSLLEQPRSGDRLF